MSSFSAISSPAPLFPSSSSSTTHRHRLSALKPPHALPIPSTADIPPAALAITTSVAALAAAISLSDPERRRQQQSQSLGPAADDKDVVRNYFNSTGFQRWKKIYGDSTDDVNKVQLDIRLGHSKTVENALKMLADDGPLAGVTVCDAGCGVGSLAIPLAEQGAVVSASDISSAMVEEARSRARALLPSGSPTPEFEVRDLESLEGRFDTVVCLDVLIHYPAEKAEGMIGKLAGLAERRLVLSYAPRTVYYDVLKRIGELFPGPSKATRAYLHSEKEVERALEKAGWKVEKRGFIGTQFYFSNLIQAVPIGVLNIS